MAREEQMWEEKQPWNWEWEGGGRGNKIGEERGKGDRRGRWVSPAMSEQIDATVSV